AEQYAPASVLVDAKFRVLYFHGETETYLSQPSGEPTRDLLTLLRGGLRTKVRELVARVFSNGKSVQATARMIEDRGNSRVGIAVTPMPASGAGEDLALVSFQMDVKRAVRPQQQRPRRHGDSESDDELRAVRSELQSTIEELETSNEELKASN